MVMELESEKEPQMATQKDLLSETQLGQVREQQLAILSVQKKEQRLEMWLD